MAELTPTPGIRHITCIAGDPQENLDFWVETLGLRLAKRSVNQGDPSTYHFFFTDAAGTPGTSTTFFPWKNLSRGKVGTRQVSRTVFRAPGENLDYREDRFGEYGVDYDDRAKRFGETILPFSDPSGLPVELAEVEVSDGDPTVPWTEFVPKDAAIRGFHSVTLWPADPQPTEDLLETMSFERVGTEEAQGDTPGDERTWFAVIGSVGKYVDVLPTIGSGQQGLGTIHHVAFQTPIDEDQEVMHKAVQSKGPCPTAQINRHWFWSVYFREFGGVLFGPATSDPGYTVDESFDGLGGHPVLLGEFEGQREQIEAGLTDVTVPRAESTEADD